VGGDVECTKKMERVKKEMKKERKKEKEKEKEKEEEIYFFWFGRKNCEKRRKNKTRDL